MLDSRDSLRSSSLAVLTPAVLSSSGFVERVSPFQSTRAWFGRPVDLPAWLPVADPSRGFLLLGLLNAFDALIEVDIEIAGCLGREIPDPVE